MIDHKRINVKHQVCTNCVMDTSDPKIIFDELGVCDHCNTFFKSTLPNWDAGRDGMGKLHTLAKRIKSSSKDKDFDCIIGMSGGIDSSYLVYAAKEIMGLRPLVFHVDAGWNSQIAVNNIEKLVDGLGLDLYTEVVNWGEMKDLQRAFIKSGVSHIDTPQDHAFFATMYKFATKHKINYILTGANLSTECVRNPVNWMYYQSDSKQIRDIHRIYGEGKLDTFPLTNILWHKVWLPYVRGIKVEKPLDLLPYVKNDAKTLLMEKFGWQPYPQKHFESRFTKFYESFWLPKRFGIDVRKVQYSSLILTDQMTRDQALLSLRNSSYDEREICTEIEFVANKLDMSKEELLQYLEIPHKTYKDYKNQMKLYNVGANVMRAFGLEIGGKR